MGGEEDGMGGNWLGVKGGAVWETKCVGWTGEGKEMWGEGPGTVGVGTAGRVARRCGESTNERLA